MIEAFDLRVNNATITGESLPRACDAEASGEADFMHSSNVLLAGTSVVSGDATALVFAAGAHTAFGQIAHLTQAAKEPLSPLQKEVARLGWAFLAAGVLALSLVVAGPVAIRQEIGWLAIFFKRFSGRGSERHLANG